MKSNSNATPNLVLRAATCIAREKTRSGRVEKYDAAVVGLYLPRGYGCVDGAPVQVIKLIQRKRTP